MIKLKDVCFQYEKTGDRVSNINLEIQKGEFIVLIGTSGSGKTTVTRIINGLAPYFYEGDLSGRVEIDEKDAASLSMWERGKLVGSIFQDPKSQFFSKQVDGEIAFGCENYGLQTEEMIERVNSAIGVMNMESLRKRDLFTLSNGERQKTAIASIWAVSPKVYVFDEPSSNLDTEGTACLATVMRRLKDSGCTIIVAEHRLYYLMDLADRFVYMEEGEISNIFTIAEMKRKSETELGSLGLRNTKYVEINEVEMAGNTYVNPDEKRLLVENLFFKYKKDSIFNNLSFGANAGDIVAVTGTNGAGKTTLAKVVCGLLKENGGEIFINSKKCGRRERQKKIWFVMHDSNSQLFGESVADELLLMTRRSEKDIEKARYLLKELGLYQYRDRHPTTLSGGQKQRLSLAAAMMHDADILVLDEPTSGLDAENMKRVAQCFRLLAAKGKTILVITHDHELVRESCTKILNMANDRTIQSIREIKTA